jgi:hypothetical protein
VSLSRLWTFLAVALPVVAALAANLPSVDLAYHLRAGAEILATGSIPNVDTWTFTAAGAPWLDQQWGAQVVLRMVESAGGWTGLALFRAGLVGLIYACLFVIGRRAGLPARATALLVLAAFLVGLVALALRPQLLGMACFALVLLLVTIRHQHRRALWLVPVVVVVWANLHGSFFLGPLVLGLAWLEDLHNRAAAPHRPLVIAVISTAAACLTPFGPAVWAYAIGLSTNPLVTSRITEWQPTSLRDVPGLLFFASALAIVVVIARRARPVPWPTLVWLGCFFFIGAFAIRGVAWWSLAAMVATVTLIAPLSRQPTRVDPPLIRKLNALVAAVFVLVGVVLLPAWRPIDPGSQAPVGVVGTAPSGITGALRDHVRPGDRLFHPQPWGSWFEYAVPTASVTIDSRIELFPPETWDRYESVAAGRAGWRDQLRSWGVTVIVVTDARPGGLLDQLTREPGWREIYKDVDGRVFARDAGSASVPVGPQVPLARGVWTHHSAILGR